MTGILLSIATIILSVLSRKYFEPILPDKKKAASYIKKFFRFTTLYIVPIVLIILIYFVTENVNKLFVISNCMLFSVLFFNLILDTISMKFKYYEYKFELKN